MPITPPTINVTQPPTKSRKPSSNAAPVTTSAASSSSTSSASRTIGGGDSFSRRPVTPPAVTPTRVVPPSVNANPPRVVPPSVNPNPGRRVVPPTVIVNQPVQPPVVVVPPAVHVPRYYYQPSFPVILPTEPRPIPQIPVPPAPQGPRPVGLNEVPGDAVDLLASYGRLRKGGKFLWATTHPEITAEQARNELNQKHTIFLAPDGGMHGNNAYQPITDVSQLQAHDGEVRSQKRNDMQAGENQAAENRLNAWVESDIQNRQNALPAFNSIYDMGRLNLNDQIISQSNRSFNRHLITAMNVYNQPDTRRAIAEAWHANPNMSTGEFNRMANNILTSKINNLYWDANYQGDYGTYLGSNPVPGLRYPDTQEDIDWNANTIRKMSQEVPMLLNSAVMN